MAKKSLDTWVACSPKAVDLSNVEKGRIIINQYHSHFVFVHGNNFEEAFKKLQERGYKGKLEELYFYFMPSPDINHVWAA